ncbi:leucyl aminopeptidase [Patescibacteria group bacterium]|nr:leucyl aminopeptidase [Patescibacteria group bacterium]
MKLFLSKTLPKTDLLFIGLFEKEKLPSKTTNLLGKEAAKLIEKRLKDKDFEGENGDFLTLYPDTGSAKKIVLFGLGKKEKIGIQAMEKTAAKCAAIAKKAKAKRVTALLEDEDIKDFFSGFILGEYEFSRYKSKNKKETPIESLTLVCNLNKTTKESLQDAQVFMESSRFIRDLVNTPAADLNTLDLASKAKELAKKYRLKIQEFDEKKLASLNCGGILGVGKGADHPPRMVVIEYKHRSKSKTPNIAFVGKGITFDTGGLNLKPTGYIETMKQDMAGAATVLGTLDAIARAKLSGHFAFVIALAENAISHKSIHPGDVLKAFNGKTIEVTNTDAEGRLVLADALSYAESKLKPKVILDIATLTGAVSVALGFNITAVLGNDKKLINEAKEAAKEANERVWELPLDEDFIEATKGDITDVKNSTDGVRAGTSMGAAFLANFIDKVKWTHFDIGGTAWAEKPESRTKYGATSVMLRTFYEIAKRHSS